MTLEEARTRLGLPSSGPLEQAELRRAYLQAIKRYKPEVDPQGFQAVREAYELLDGLVRAGVPLSQPIAVVETPGETGQDEGEDDEDEPYEVPVDPFASAAHLAPYRQRLAGLFGQPWPIRAQVGWDAYRAFPGDAAARAFLLSLLPEEAIHDRTIVLREGVAAGDRDCLLQLLEVAPQAVPPDAIARLDSEGSTFERLLVAGALARNEPERALALLDRVLTADAGGLPELMAVDGALRLGLRFEGNGDGARARAVWARLRQYLGGTALPAGAPQEITALYALAAGLEAAEYLPAQVRGEVARGALQWSWPGLAPTLSVVERAYGKSNLRNDLERVRRDSPALASLLDQHMPVVVTGTTWNPAILRIVLPVLLLALGRASFNGCNSSPAPSPEMMRRFHEDFLASERAVKVEKLKTELTLYCRPPDERAMCKVLPTLLDSFRQATVCLDADPLFENLRKDDTTPTEREYLSRVRAAMPELCKP